MVKGQVGKETGGYTGRWVKRQVVKEAVGKEGGG